MRSRHRLAVLEGRWFEEKNTSVKGLFDLLLDRKSSPPPVLTPT